MIVLLSVHAIPGYANNRLDEAIKMIQYERWSSAKNILNSLTASEPTNPVYVYWLGQAYLLSGLVDSAQIIYTNALNSNINSPWIWVGQGSVEIAKGGSLQSAEQKFEQAIQASVTKRKKKNDPAILDAIGRANAYGGTKYGDPIYAIGKLNEAGNLDLKNSDIFINMGICYQKMGPDSGGRAVESYTEAINRDPNDARGFYRIGKIYESQQNESLYDDYFNKAILADSNFPLTYLELFEIYKNTDVNQAKQNLDLYIEKSDKNPQNDFYMADYLYQSGAYQSSIDKANEIIKELGGTNSLKRLNILLAFDYTKMGDSLKAKSYVESYFDNPNAEITPVDGDLVALLYPKFNDSTTLEEGVQYMLRAEGQDSSKPEKIRYMSIASNLAGLSHNYSEKFNLLNQYNQLKGYDKMDEVDVYNTSKASLEAKDYNSALNNANNYIAKYPKEPQGYSFKVQASRGLDTNYSGLLKQSLLEQNKFYMLDTTQYKANIVANFYEITQYYNNQIGSDPTQIPFYIACSDSAIHYCDIMLTQWIPNDPNITQLKEAFNANKSKFVAYQKYLDKQKALKQKTESK